MSPAPLRDRQGDKYSTNAQRMGTAGINRCIRSILKSNNQSGVNLKSCAYIIVTGKAAKVDSKNSSAKSTLSVSTESRDVFHSTTCNLFMFFTLPRSYQ